MMAAMATWMGGSAERPARFFSTPQDFNDWLAQHHATETELWMGLYGKHVPERGLTWEQAVEEALCWGWIDSVAQRIDANSRRQRWTPRRPTSNWSKVNLALIERLTAEGRMQPPGLAIWERRKTTPAGYSFEGEAALPPEYEARLRADPAAEAFYYGRATPSYRRVCATWVFGAKTDVTREKRFNELIADSAAGRLIRPQRYGDVPKWAQ